MNCENCNTVHDGTYGSGRFCTVKCSRSFSTKTNREEINEKVSRSLTGKPLSENHPSRKGWAYSEEIRQKKATTRRATAYRLLIESPFGELKGHGRRRLRVIYEQNSKCLECGVGEEWNGKHLAFHLDHIDGNSKNDKRENLRALCPNCHSQTDTYSGRNKGNYDPL